MTSVSVTTHERKNYRRDILNFLDLDITIIFEPVNAVDNRLIGNYPGHTNTLMLSLYYPLQTTIVYQI